MPWFRTILLVALMLIPAPLAAQQPAFNIDGWRYELRPGDVHAYSCAGQCNRSSHVSYRLYDPDLRMTLDEFRKQQGDAARMLESRMPPGSKVEIISVTEERKNEMRMLKAQRLHSYPSGGKEHVISAFVFGAPRPFSLISSSDDEAAAKANFQQFVAPIWLVVGMGARRP